MQMTTDIHIALVQWESDDSQWIITDGTQYGVGHEADAIYALTMIGWEITSPEELARQIRN